jgi:nucleoside-diphosphate-sugar epimerase
LNERLPKKVLYLSSVLVYGEAVEPATEETPCYPADQYSQFKCAAEALLCERLDQKIALGVLRLANVYGGRKNRGFIGLVMDRLAQGRGTKLVLNGDGLQERDYIFIDDVVAALIAVKRSLKQNDTINIATGESHTLLDILYEVAEITGQPLLYEKNNKELVEVGKSRIKNEKLEKQYHFSPFYGLRTGLQETYLRSVVPQEKISGKKFLFIGGEGFIGRNLATYFSKENDCTSVGQHPSLFTGRRDAYIKADPYRDVISGEYDVVVHLIDNKIPLSVFESEEQQLVGHFSLRPGGHLILFSSAVVYANPNSEYGKRKKTLEAFYTRYCSEHNITLTIFRPFNIFGPFQLPYRQGSLVANLMCNFLLNKSTEINDMEARRDFMYVADIARFVERALVGKRSGVFDIGSGRLIQIRDLIECLDHNVFPVKGNIVDKHTKEHTPDQPAERTLSLILPMVDFDEGLKRTFAFYRSNTHLLQEYAKRKSR